MTSDNHGLRFYCPRKFPSIKIIIVAAIFACVFLTAANGAPEAKQISIYSNIANYSLPVVDENGHEYVGIFEVLEPLGNVTERVNSDHWTLRYNDINCDFKPGDPNAQINGSAVPLGYGFVLRNGRGLVPVHSLSALLPKLLGGPVNLNEATRRLFIGDAGIHFTAQIKSNTPSSLVMDFSSRVNPTIATEPGKITLVFMHEPLMPPGAPVLTFANKDIPSLTYAENNGAAQITVSATVPLFASFSNNGKTITVQAAPQSLPAPTAAAINKNPSVTGTSSTTQLSGIPFRYFAIIDAAHGGQDNGASLGVQLNEKDITLALARRLRDELEVRGVTVMLLRNDDTTLTTDQRAAIANQQHEAIYICLHVTSQGQGVRLYTALIPAGDNNHGPFLGWQTAQSPFLSSSQNAAAIIGSELQKTHITAKQLMAPLRPLNSIISAAIAIEVSPPSSDASSVNSPSYQQYIASALASGIADLRNNPANTQGRSQ